MLDVVDAVDLLLDANDARCAGQRRRSNRISIDAYEANEDRNDCNDCDYNGDAGNDYNYDYQHGSRARIQAHDPSYGRRALRQQRLS